MRPRCPRARLPAGCNRPGASSRCAPIRSSANGKFVGKGSSRPKTLPDARVFIEGIRRDGQILEFGPDTVLQAGDVVAVSGRREVLVNMLQTATEVEDRELLDVPAEAVDVVVTKGDRPQDADRPGQGGVRAGIYLTKITRGAMSVDIPVLPQTQVYRGDILRLVGTAVHLDRVVQAIGYADRLTATDMVYVGVGIVLGGLFGAWCSRSGGSRSRSRRRAARSSPASFSAGCEQCIRPSERVPRRSSGS